MHSVESRVCDTSLNAQLPSQERIQQRFFRSRNHVSADELSIGAGCLSSGIDRCAHRADIASDKASWLLLFRVLLVAIPSTSIEIAKD